jgi:hypothetical protein
VHAGWPPAHPRQHCAGLDRWGDELAIGSNPSARPSKRHKRLTQNQSRCPSIQAYLTATPSKYAAAFLLTLVYLEGKHYAAHEDRVEVPEHYTSLFLVLSRPSRPLHDKTLLFELLRKFAGAWAAAGGGNRRIKRYSMRKAKAPLPLG